MIFACFRPRALFSAALVVSSLMILGCANEALNRGASNPVGPAAGAESSTFSGTVLFDDQPKSRINLYLVNPKGSLNRRLSRSKKDLENIRGYSHFLDVQPDFQTVSDENGCFDFSRIPPGDYSLLAFDGKNGRSMSIGVKAGIPATLSLSLIPVGGLNGKISLPGNESKAGIYVGLEGTPFFDMTNGQGEFFLPDIPAGNYSLTAMRGEYGLEKPISLAIPPAQVLEIAPIALAQLPLLGPGSGGLVGTISRNPFALGDNRNEGLIVHLADTSFVTCTNARGGYSFSRIPTGTYALEVPSELYKPAMGQASGPFRVRIESGKVTQAPEWVLVPRSFSPSGLSPGGLEGYLARAPSDMLGSPSFEGIQVKLSAGKVFFHEVTDEAGYFKFRNIPPGSYFLDIFAPNYSAASFSHQLLQIVPSATVSLNEREVPIFLTLRSELLGRIAGSLTLPLPPGGLQVELVKEAKGLVRRVQVNPQGEFFCIVEAGSYTLKIPTESGFSFFPSHAISVTLESGGTVNLPSLPWSNISPQVRKIEVSRLNQSVVLTIHGSRLFAEGARYIELVGVSDSQKTWELEPFMADSWTPASMAVRFRDIPDPGTYSIRLRNIPDGALMPIPIHFSIPPVPPLNVQIAAFPDSLNLTWKNPPGEKYVQIIFEFPRGTFQYRKTPEGAFNLNNLPPDTAVTFWLAGMTDSGELSEKFQVTGKTLPVLKSQELLRIFTDLLPFDFQAWCR